MSGYVKVSRLILSILLPMLCSLVLSAIVSLQLFQDGSSYLLEILISHSAIRHHRSTVLLIQGPTMFIARLLARTHTDPNHRLQAIRLVFSLSYSLIPFISLILSWAIVQRKNENLFVWAALIILFTNLVNFSWVSELLISLQLACPLLLVAILMPGTRQFWGLAIILLPLIFFLHPLVSLILMTIAIGCGYMSFKNLNRRPAFLFAAIIFLVAATARGILSIYSLTPYEKSFLEVSGMNDYILTTSKENIFFLIISLFIGVTCMFSESLQKSNRQKMFFISLFLLVQASTFVLILANLHFINYNIKIMIFLVGEGFMLISQGRSYFGRSSATIFKSPYHSCIILAIMGAILLVSQYFSGSGRFPLKTGLALLVSLLMMLMMSIDSQNIFTQTETMHRFRLVITLAIVFSVVIASKSLIWYSSVHKLEKSLVVSNGDCTEVVSDDFTWLQRNPYNIINNWSLPSLALVMQDHQPRKLLLEAHSCKLFYELGMVQIDPWTKIPQESLKPSLK